MSFLKSLFGRKSPEAYMHAATRAIESGKYEEALPLCDKAIGIDSRCFDAWVAKAAIYSEHLNQQEDALRCYDQAITILKGPLTLFGKGAKGLDYFVNAAAQAAHIDKARVVAWNGKGLVLEKLGRREEALSCYEEIRKTGKAEELASFQISRLLELMGKT
jgi:tetratricopeptide (TPR) repeat protein